MKFLSRVKKHFTYRMAGNIALVLFCALILMLSIRGIPGTPSAPELNMAKWKDNGPLELSPERGRYAIVYAFLELNSFEFPPDLARFVAPDVAYESGRYLSLFVPGLSFVAMPGYILGKMFGMAQYGTFAVISLFALLNFLLIRMISTRFGANIIAGNLAGLTFLFGSPAFAYGVTLYQHHVSTFLILFAVYLLIRFNSFWSLLLIWAIAAASVTIDYPNFFMMIPVGLYGLGKLLFVKKVNDKTTVQFPLLRVLTFIGVILPVAFLMWYNTNAYGDPMKLSGNIERALRVNPDGSPVLEAEQQLKEMKEKGIPISQYKPTKSMVNAFLTRNLLNGFYIHFISPDRGMLYFTPVMFVGFFGLILAIKKRMKYVALLTGVIGFNVLLYSMWGDPYGGWAFGSRYMIPTYAILSIFIAFVLTKYAKQTLFLLMFFILMSYSVGVNTIGALTSNRNPPQVEAEGLAKVSGKEELYTYERNMKMLDNNTSKSYVYNTYFANSVSAWNYFGYIFGLVTIVSAFIVVLLRYYRKGVNHEN